MDKQTFHDGEYEITHVNYSGRYGGDDIVCQVQRHGVEVPSDTGLFHKALWM